MRPIPSIIRRSRGKQAGFTLLDVMISAAVLSVALLGHASTVLTGHRLSRDVERRTVAIEALGQFVERLRSDPDWAGMYAGLVSLSTSSRAAAGELPGRLPTDHYADYVAPASLGEVRVLVEVPRLGADLREDVLDPRHGLPYDLNGDGVVDAEPRQGDYVVLPVAVTFSWRAPGEGVQSVRVGTWLSGARR